MTRWAERLQWYAMSAWSLPTNELSEDELVLGVGSQARSSTMHGFLDCSEKYRALNLSICLILSIIARS